MKSECTVIFFVLSIGIMLPMELARFSFDDFESDMHVLASLEGPIPESMLRLLRPFISQEEPSLHTVIPLKNSSSLGWHPHSDKLAVGAFGGHASIFDVGVKRPLAAPDSVRVLEGECRGWGAKVFVAWNKDGDKIAIQSDRDEALLRQRLSANGGDGDRIDLDAGCMAWSPHGNRFAYSSEKFDEQLEQLGLPTGQIYICDRQRNYLQFLPGDGRVRAISWSKSGVRIAVVRDRCIDIWHSLRGEKIRKIPGMLSAHAWHPSQEHVLATSKWYEDQAQIWNTVTGELCYEVPHDGVVRAICWSPDGKILATGGRDSTVGLWNAQDGEPLFRLKNQFWITSLAWSPDGSRLAAGTDNGLVEVWEPSSGTALYLINYYHYVYDYKNTRAIEAGLLAWNAAGTKLAISGRESAPMIWYAPEPSKPSSPVRDYYLLYLLMKYNEKGYPIDLARYASLQKAIANVSDDMKVWMRQYLRLTVDLGVEEDRIAQELLQPFADEQFANNKEFIMVAVPATGSDHYFEVTYFHSWIFGPGKLYDTTIEHDTNPGNAMQFKPADVCYYKARKPVADDQSPTLLFIGTLEDLCKGNVRGMKMRDLIDENYGDDAKRYDCDVAMG